SSDPRRTRILVTRVAAIHRATSVPRRGRVSLLGRIWPKQRTFSDHSDGRRARLDWRTATFAGEDVYIRRKKPGALHTRRRAVAVQRNDARRRSEKDVASRYTRNEKVRRRHEIRASERCTVATTVRVTHLQEETPMFPQAGPNSRDVFGLRLAAALV